MLAHRHRWVWHFSALLRRSLTISSAPDKPVFFDMLHSNNAARVRLWMSLKRPGGMSDAIETRMIQYPDLQKEAYGNVNPLRKVPALIRPDGDSVFESNVILSYLEDKYADAGLSFVPSTPEQRQKMELLIRIHDLYVASPNCTAPGFSHSQGAMYLSYGWHGAARGMDLATRAAKLAELWKQLCWLEVELGKTSALGPHLVGDRMTLADFTWFPTCCFMEYLLPRFFGWPHLFEVHASEPAPTPFPHLAKWYSFLREHIAFAKVRDDILAYWGKMEAMGQFQPILDELIANEDPSLKIQYGVPQAVSLNYQETPSHGKVAGRYIDQPDRGDVVDEHVASEVMMHDARELVPPAALDTHGFTLRVCPSDVTDFENDAELRERYYPEMSSLLREVLDARAVLVFDHTLRESNLSNLNAAPEGSAGPVARVHCDYTVDGAPRRLARLALDGIYSSHLNRNLKSVEVEALAAGHYAFVNVWRPIDRAHPVLQMPLAVCAEPSVPSEDRFLYELRFPDRTGENYSLRHSDAHRWFYYPRQTADECLIFKVFDKDEHSTRFVFHTAFNDPSSPLNPPPRRSIEVRTVVFFEAPVNDGTGKAAESVNTQGKHVLF